MNFPLGVVCRSLRAQRPSICAKTPWNVFQERCLFSTQASPDPLLCASSLVSRWNDAGVRIGPCKTSANLARLTRNFATGGPKFQQQNSEKALSAENGKQAHEFSKSKKASRAATVNFAAKLSNANIADDNATFKDVWRLIKIARPEARWLSFALGCLLLSSTLAMIIPYSIGQVLDVAAKGDDDARLFGLTMNQFFIGLGGLLTIGSIAIFGEVVMLRIIGQRVITRLRAQLYRRTMGQDAEFFDANRVGDLLSRLSTDASLVGKAVTQNLSDGIGSLFIGAAGFGIMAWTSPKLTSILLLVFPPVAIIAALYGRSISGISRAMQKNLGILSKIVEERLGAVRTSQSFVGEGQEVARYNKQLRNIFSVAYKESLVTGSFYASTGWAGKMTILIMLMVGGNAVKTGAMSLGDLTSYMMYTAFAGSGLFGVSEFYSELMKGAGAASRLFELQDRHPSIHQTVGKRVRSAQGDIVFKDVSFAYPTRPGIKIFNKLGFEIKSGSNVCVVGPSGGGKSTIASLLLRFYNPTSGAITINGAAVSTMNTKSLRRRIGMVAQEPVLFSATIAENIAYGKPNASREDILSAARQANCNFISDLPEGLETPVGPRGSQLSGGQKQRIAIARALLKDPDILILDEATSALDAESEALINNTLARVLKARMTTISIAHRLSTIKRSDQVIVLNSEGVVAEVGSFADLSADKDSAFSKLMEKQMNSDMAHEPFLPLPELEADSELEDVDVAAGDGKQL